MFKKFAEKSTGADRSIYGKCNLCGNSQFGDMGPRRNVVCTQCGSLERTRLAGLYIDSLSLTRPSVLHIAPERGLFEWLNKKYEPSKYVAADLFPEDIKFTKAAKLDLCSLESLPSNEFDLIIHSHVMEHVKCNYAVPLFHLDRALARDGAQVVTIPFMSGYFEEDLGPISAEDASERFGQYDHVRRFGSEDIERHLGAVITLPKSIDHTRHFPRSTLKNSNIPETVWRVWGHSSVVTLRKGDYKIA